MSVVEIDALGIGRNQQWDALGLKTMALGILLPSPRLPVNVSAEQMLLLLLLPLGCN